MANASNPISPSWATSINCPMEKKQGKSTLLSACGGCHFSLLLPFIFLQEFMASIFPGLPMDAGNKIYCRHSTRVKLSLQLMCRLAKESSSGKTRFSDFTGITAEGSLEHTEHCMWEILYHKRQKDSSESNTVTIKLLSNHFIQKTDLECTSSIMSQRNYELWYCSEFGGLYQPDGAAPSHVVVYHCPSQHNA